MNRKYIGISATIILLVGIIGSILTFPSAMKQAEEQKIEEVVKAQEIKNIQVDSNLTKIKILPTTNRDIRVVYKTKKDENDPLSIETDDSTLTIQTKNKVRFPFRFFISVESLHIFIPEEDYHRLAVTNKNGTIDVQEISVRDLSLETNNGKTTIKGTSGRTIDVKTNNGVIQLTNVTGEVTGRTHNGMITLETEHLDRTIDLEAHNGKITIQTEKKPTNTTFDLSIGNGKIDVFGQSTWDDVVGSGDYLVKVSSNNGMITIK